MKRREANFENICRVLRREVPDRPTLFELFMNRPLYELANGRTPDKEDRLTVARFVAEAYANLGYDYATVHACNMSFPTEPHVRAQSISLNQGAMIHDMNSLEAYPWPDPDAQDYSVLDKIHQYLPDGMKLMVMGPGGVLENAISLVGYDDLCYALYEQPELARRVFDGVGERLLRYYENALDYPSVGFICSNDDWGFNTQTFLSPDQMREYVFPWHKKIVDVCHAAGKPVILHSCGNMRDIIDDVVAMGYDGKHSYEDVILPVEQAYEDWHERIAILGGIDMNFICRRSPAEVAARTAAMVERTRERGGYMVGTGNSVPEYLPVKGFMAMIEAAIGYNPLDR